MKILDCDVQKVLDGIFKNSYFRKFMCDSAENIIQVRVNERKELKDSIKFDAHIPFENKSITFIPPIPVELSKEKFSSNEFDKTIIEVLSTDSTSNRIVFAGNSTNETEIGNSDIFSTATIRKALNIASNYQKRDIHAINVDGNSFYVMLIDEKQAEDLMKDSTWQASEKELKYVDTNNPIFNGALGICHRVIVYKCPYIFKENNKNDITVRHALFLGAQAVLIGVGKYKDSSNIEFGIEKAQFTSTEGTLTDLGVINILTA